MEYLIFLTADHGVSHVPGFLTEHKIPAGNFDNEKVTEGLNQYLLKSFGTDNLAIGIFNYQVSLDRQLMVNKHLQKDSVYSATIQYLKQFPAIERAFALDALRSTTVSSKIQEALANSYQPNRSGDIQLIFRPQWIDGFVNGGTTPGLWNPYDSHIPFVWSGWTCKQGKSNKEFYMTDIAPTIAAMLSIQMPSGSIGHVIEDIFK